MYNKNKYLVVLFLYLVFEHSLQNHWTKNIPFDLIPSTSIFVITYNISFTII